jgi:hypothetical protein
MIPAAPPSMADHGMAMRGTSTISRKSWTVTTPRNDIYERIRQTPIR